MILVFVITGKLYLLILSTKTFLQVEALHNDQANTDFSIMCELLKDYIALIGAVKVWNFSAPFF